MNDITQAELEVILCRPLTPCEVANFSLYIEAAKDEIRDMLCWDPFVTTTGPLEFNYEASLPYYLLRPFKSLTSVSIVNCGAEEVQDILCDWKPVDRHGNPTSGCAIALRRCYCKTCEEKTCCDNKCKTLRVNADFSCEIPEIKLLLSQLFSVQATACDDNVQSKNIRSFSVTYREKEKVQDSKLYARVKARWALCTDYRDVRGY